MKQIKHITIVGLNFYPESTAIGLYSTQLAQYLEENGYVLHIITAFPYYPEWKIAKEYRNKKRYLKEKLGEIHILRYKLYVPKKPTFLKRILHIISFTWGSFWNTFKIKECDLVLSVVPFTSATLLGYILKKRFGAKHWIHIQDFEFDAAFQSGLTTSGESKGGFIYRLLMTIEKSLYSRADRVSTISHSMIDKLKNKTTAPTYYLPNWIDENGVNPAFAKAHNHMQSSKFKILYSGNIGDKQDWDFFLELVKQLDFSVFEVILVGAGAMRSTIQEKVIPFEGIHLHDPVPYEELSDLLCSADVHILFQKPKVLDTVMPSKILGMMASSKPSIITGHPDSEVAQVMQDAQAGFYNSDGKVTTVLHQLHQLVAQSDMSQSMGIQARSYVLSHFAKDKILSSFAQTLEEL